MRQIINTRDKKIYYLAGLPRTGNTVLGSILNQNPKIKVSLNSILVELVWRLHSIKKDRLFLNVKKHLNTTMITQMLNLYLIEVLGVCQ